MQEDYSDQRQIIRSLLGQLTPTEEAALVRRRAALLFRQREVIPGMIDRIKTLLMPGATALPDPR